MQFGDFGFGGFGFGEVSGGGGSGPPNQFTDQIVFENEVHSNFLFDTPLDQKSGTIFIAGFMDELSRVRVLSSPGILDRCDIRDGVLRIGLETTSFVVTAIAPGLVDGFFTGMFSWQENGGQIHVRKMLNGATASETINQVFTESTMSDITAPVHFSDFIDTVRFNRMAYFDGLFIDDLSVGIDSFFDGSNLLPRSVGEAAFGPADYDFSAQEFINENNGGAAAGTMDTDSEAYIYVAPEPPTAQFFGGSGYNDYPILAPVGRITIDDANLSDTLTASILTDASGIFEMTGEVIYPTSPYANDATYPLTLRVNDGTHDVDIDVDIIYSDRPTGLISNPNFGYNITDIRAWPKLRIYLNILKNMNPIWLQGGAHIELTPTEYLSQNSTGDFDELPSTRIGDGVKCLLLENGEFSHLAGNWRIEWEGRGTAFVETTNFGSMGVSGGSTIWNFDGLDTKIYLGFTEIDPADPIRITSIVRVEHTALFAAGELLHPEAKRKIQSSKTIRFMPATRTNGSFADEFTNRSNYNFNTWNQEFGIPWEVVCQISNIAAENGAKAWVNVPELFSDQAIVDLVNFLYANLDPECELIIEYSNEPWLAQFKINADLKQNPCPVEELTDKMTGYANDYEYVIPRVGYRSAFIAKTAKDIFGDRVEIVINCQTPVTANSINGIDRAIEGVAQYIDDNGLTESPSDLIAALAHTSYFGTSLNASQRTFLQAEITANGQSATQEAYLKYVLDGVDAGFAAENFVNLVDQRRDMKQRIKDAAAHGLGYKIYEGSHHLHTENGLGEADISQFVLETVNHPLMAACQYKMMTNMLSLGIQDIALWGLYFDNADYTAWGIEEYPGQNTIVSEVFDNLNSIDL